jgi:hypothetical protein
MSEINVISTTQKIIVDPASYSVSVIYTGPAGPAGPPGPPGTLSLFNTDVSHGPFNNLPASPNFISLPSPGPVKADVNVSQPHAVLTILTAYIDSNIANNEISLAINMSGATNKIAGALPEQILKVGGKQPVSSTMSISYIDNYVIGISTVELLYKATVHGGNISDVSVTLVALS